ncbi:hypothetical protein [Streptomyces sp. NPDC057909]|uniref:hypothetical protein n=1 Tax=Streptomyces sp. NPDC057909 TaxID=3346277 RepID=UPI0036E88136
MASELFLVDLDGQAPGQSNSNADGETPSNAQDLWVGFGVGAEGRTFPSDRLLVIE